MFLALSVAFKGSYGFSGALIISSYGWLFSRQIRRNIKLTFTEKGLVVVLLGYLCSVILEVVFYQLPLREIDAEGKILLLLPLVFILNAVQINFLVTLLGIAAGALGLFVLAAYETYFLGLDRTGTFINAIQLGNIAMAFSFIAMLLSPIIFKINNKGTLLGTLMILAGLLGFYASLSTLTRGGLLFAPILLTIVGLYNVRSLKKHYKMFVLALSLGCVSAFTLLPDSGIISRFSVAFENYENYFNKGNASSSTGIRLEMWKAAAIISSDNPLLGIGAIEYETQKNQLIESGIINASIGYYDHPHNAYLYAIARRGLIGLVFFLALLFYPIYIAHREIRQNNSTCSLNSPAMALLIFGLFFVFANITQVLFAHNSGMIMYTGLLILLVSLMVSMRKA